MTTLVEELSQKARTLSPEDRARLAEDLLASLEDGSESPSEVGAAWEHEIRQRVEEVKSGTAKLIPAEDVYAETRRIHQK
jgi:putative addiction module component (TIGR02574 family)